MNEGTWIVYGCSPFVCTVEGRIPYLLERYTSVGLNVFPSLFKKCEYWLFNDNGVFTNLVKKNYSGEKLVVNSKLLPEMKMFYFRPGQCVIKNSYIIKPHYIFEGVSEISQHRNGKLLYSNSSVLSAINFALVNGAKRVILVGIDLKSDWGHFYDGERSSKSSHYIEMIRNKILLFRRYIEVLKVNKAADIDIDYVDISEL